MDGMEISHSERVWDLAEKLVWRMSLHELRLELTDRMHAELMVKPEHELWAAFEDEGIAQYVGEEV